MQIHEIKPKNKLKKAKRIGRGGKRGTYSGKGIKGQKSRSGVGGVRISEKGRSSWIKRFPKLGGFSSVYLKNIVVKTSDLEKQFKTGAIIDAKSLAQAGLIDKIQRGRSGKLQLIKILNDGPVKKKFTVSGCLLSKSAIKTIEKAGGQIQNIPQKKKPSQKKVAKKVAGTKTLSK